ncbi:hypothetical protein BDZ90DRAFT_102434 [Jaminaea rosea]|uniref:Uncharacterized protein n=1 Tax=Jaminaea rosea TaxID=1569628 RepID=A0A316UHA9_9BASI|nr:hypothetical protein BDZ90DRAFT_102434 [Jaminaea rosea]PWN24642.1 hypothetical protein BDZ90DRAFT_102434 [Jaminaea rosea]
MVCSSLSSSLGPRRSRQRNPVHPTSRFLIGPAVCPRQGRDRYCRAKGNGVGLFDITRKRELRPKRRITRKIEDDAAQILSHRVQAVDALSVFQVKPPIMRQSLGQRLLGFAAFGRVQTMDVRVGRCAPTLHCRLLHLVLADQRRDYSVGLEQTSPDGLAQRHVDCVQPHVGVVKRTSSAALRHGVGARADGESRSSYEALSFSDRRVPRGKHTAKVGYD